MNSQPDDLFCVMICSQDHDYNRKKEKNVSYELKSVFSLIILFEGTNHSLMITCRLKITIKFCCSNQFRGGLSALGHVLMNIYRSP